MLDHRSCRSKKRRSGEIQDSFHSQIDDFTSENNSLTIHNQELQERINDLESQPIISCNHIVDTILKEYRLLYTKNLCLEANLISTQDDHTKLQEILHSLDFKNNTLQKTLEPWALCSCRKQLDRIPHHAT